MIVMLISHMKSEVQAYKNHFLLKSIMNVSQDFFHIFFYEFVRKT